LGLSGLAGELPGLIGSLRGALLKAMSKKIVEPNRKYLDLSKIYHAKFVAKARINTSILILFNLICRNSRSFLNYITNSQIQHNTIHAYDCPHVS